MYHALSLVFMVTLFLSCFRPVTAADDTIRLCMETWPPFYGFTEKSGEPAGIAIDVAREIAGRLERSVEIKMLPYARCIKSVQLSHFDGHIGISANEGDLITGRHSEHYWALAAFVRDNDPRENFTSLDDFKDQVWLKDGDYEYPEALENYKGWTAHTVMFEDREETRHAEILKRKRADVYIEDYFWYNNLVNKHVLPVKALMPLVIAHPSYVGFSPSKKDLAMDWDKELEGLLADGTVNTIYQRWTGETFDKIVERFGINVAE